MDTMKESPSSLLIYLPLQKLGLGNISRIFRGYPWDLKKFRALSQRLWNLEYEENMDKYRMKEICGIYKEIWRKNDEIWRNMWKALELQRIPSFTSVYSLGEEIWKKYQEISGKYEGILCGRLWDLEKIEHTPLWALCNRKIPRFILCIGTGT